MNHNLDSQFSFHNLQEAAHAGWWQINIPQKTITFSSYLISLLGLKAETLTFEAFAALLSPASGYTDTANLQTIGFPTTSVEYDKELEIFTPKGYLQIRAKSIRQHTNDKGESIIEGFIQCTDYSYQKGAKKAKIHLNQLVNWQKSFTQMLLKLLGNTPSHLVIEELLSLILQKAEADSVRIFSMNHLHKTYSCEYEIVADNKYACKDALQKKPITGKRGYELLMKRKVAFYNQKDHLIYVDGASPEQYLNRVQTSLVIPLSSKQEVWGFIKINILDKTKRWTPFDIESLVTATNIICVCQALRTFESEITENGDFLHKLFHNMPMGYFRLRIEMAGNGEVTDYEYLDINTKFTEMIGRNRENIIGKLNSEVGPIFTNKLDLQVLADVAYKGKIFQTRGQMRHNKGYYDTTIYSPQYGDVVALFIEVTDTVSASEILKKREIELQKMYKNIPLGIEIYDKDGFMVDVNEQELKIQQISDRNVLLGLNLFEHPSLPRFAYEELRKGNDVVFDVNLDNMKVNRQYYGIDSQEQLRYLTIRANVLHNAAGEIEGYLLIIIDNTEFNETSNRLREFESAFNSVAEIAEVGFFLWNPLKNSFFSSIQSNRNIGVSSMLVDELGIEAYNQCVHPDDFGQIDTFFQKSAAGEEKELTCEFRIRYKGQWKWLRAKICVTEYAPERNSIQYICINYNVNEMKLAEQKLLEAKNKAEESDHLKSAFLANMSHEIRTPLNAIVGFADVLAETDDEEEKQQFIEIIRKNNEHLLNLISDILDLSQIESGEIEFHFSEIDANDLCEQAISPLSIKFPEQVELHFRHDSRTEENITFRGDSKWISQALSILINNAIKFTPEGHVWLSYKRQEQGIEFSVKDTGVGMTAEQTKNIFERFVKVNEFIPGTGLGLTIFQSIVEQFGGTFGVESEAGAGTRFWFTLPI